MFHLNSYTVGCHLQTQKLEQLTKQTVLSESTAEGSILKKVTWQDFILKLESYTKMDVTIIIIIIMAVQTSGCPE